MGNWTQTGLACPCGNSSDAYAMDTSGNGYCFGSCGGKFFRGNKEEEEVDNSQYKFETFEHRGLSNRILQKYSVKTKLHEDTPIETAFIYPNGSLKIRGMAAKTFKTKGDFKQGMLFGSNVYDKGSKTSITITEGEYDALAASQMIGETAAVVSVRSSVSAKADCTAQYDYLNSFDKIIINFDNDEPGQAAAKKVASLFDFKKVFNLCLDKGKDANSYLEKELQAEYYSAWRATKRYTPDNILSTMSEFRRALVEDREELLVKYPFEILQKKLFGVHEAEVVVVKGQEGIGKTEFLRALENQVFRTTKHNIGIIHLEESNSTTLRSMVGYYTKQPVLHPEYQTDDEEIAKTLEIILGDQENRFVMHSSFDVEDDDKFIDDIRFMVVANECKLIFFDHISWLATGADENGDERKKLDRISQRLKFLAKELKFGLIMVSHVNDDGKTRGSRNISKVANTVIDLTRNKTTEDESERLKMYMMIEKARTAGATEGPAGYGLYDTETLMLTDPNEKGLELPKS